MGMMDLRRRVMMAGGFSEDTATGNPLTFQTNLAKPLKSLLIPFTPIQASGTPSPSIVLPITGFSGVTVNRCGRNLFDKNNQKTGYLINSSGEEKSSSSGWNISNYIPVFGQTEITYQGLTTVGSAPRSAWYDNNLNVISVFKQAVGVNTIEVPPNAYYIRFSVVHQTGGAFDDDVFMVEYGETASAYEPYTGNSYSVTFPALGKNLFDKNNGVLDNSWTNVTQMQIVTLDGACCVYAPLESGKTYTISKMYVSGGRFSLCTTTEKPAIGTAIYQSIGNHDSTGDPFTITAGENDKYAVAFIWRGTETGVTKQQVIDSVQVEEGSSATSYEPFDNTVYGGTLDMATGVLTVDKGYTLVKDIPWDEYNTTYQRFMGTVSGIKLYPNARETPLSCSYFQVIDDKRAIGDVPNNSIYGAQNGRRISIKTTDYTTIEPFVENYGNCQIVYPLETPITYQLTPQQIATLAHQQNVIWTDTNGSNTAVFLKK